MNSAIRTPNSPPNQPADGRHVAWDRSTQSSPRQGEQSQVHNTTPAPPPPAVSGDGNAGYWDGSRGMAPPVVSASRQSNYPPPSSSRQAQRQSQNFSGQARQESSDVPVAPPVQRPAWLDPVVNNASPEDPPPSAGWNCFGGSGNADDGDDAVKKPFVWRFMHFALYFFSAIIFFLALLMLYAGYQVQEHTSSSAISSEILDFTQLLIVGGILVAIVMIIGFMTGITRNKKLFYAFGIGLILLWVGQAYQTYHLNKHVEPKLKHFTKNWDDIPNRIKNEIQILGNCCGYYDTLDRPGEYCPADAKNGCKYELYHAAEQVRSTTKSALFGSFILALVLLGLGYYVALK